MTNDELRAAAERITQYAAVTGSRTISRLRADAEKIATAYLAEHSADDAEPVTEEWLSSVGFDLRSLSASLLLDNKTGGAVVEMTLTPEPEPSNDWMVSFLQGVPDDLHRADDHVLLTSKAVKTRGDVRRLCAALGVELKEQAT